MAKVQENLLFQNICDLAFTVCHFEVILILNFTEVVYVGYMWFTDKMFRSEAYLVLRRFSFRTLAPVLVIRLLAPAGVKMFVLLCDDFSPALLLL